MTLLFVHGAGHLAWDVVIALGQRALNFNGALGRFEGALELDQESVADGFNLAAIKPRKQRAQQAPMFFQQLDRQRLIALRQCAVADHFGEHDGGQFALFGVGVHFTSFMRWRMAWTRE